MEEVSTSISAVAVLGPHAEQAIYENYKPKNVMGWLALAGGSLMLLGAATCALCVLGGLLIALCWGVGSVLFALLVAVSVGAVVAGSTALALAAGGAMLGATLLAGAAGLYVANALLQRVRSVVSSAAPGVRSLPSAPAITVSARDPIQSAAAPLAASVAAVPAQPVRALPSTPAAPATASASVAAPPSRPAERTQRSATAVGAPSGWVAHIRTKLDSPPPSPHSGERDGARQPNEPSPVVRAKGLLVADILAGERPSERPADLAAPHIMQQAVLA